jgi:hypothetical protein
MYWRHKSHGLWDDSRAQDNDLSCTKRCAGRFEPAPPVGASELEWLELGQVRNEPIRVPVNALAAKTVRRFPVNVANQHASAERCAAGVPQNPVFG